jgi:hypothetical protein
MKPRRPRPFQLDLPLDIDATVSSTSAECVAGSSGSGRPSSKTREGRKQSRTIEQRRALVSRLWLQGLTVREIGKEINSSDSVVYTDVAAIRNTWREDTKEYMAEFLNRELARVDLIEAEAWKAWKLSLTERQRKMVEKDTKGNKVKLMREGQCGNPQYLALIGTCIETRRKLLGLDKQDGAAAVKGTTIQPDRLAIAMDATVPAGPEAIQDQDEDRDTDLEMGDDEDEDQGSNSGTEAGEGE